MSRGLGTALTLSILAHGGAAATVGVIGAAWLTGAPAAPPSPALYVDLVHPVVAMSDGPAAGAAERHAPAGRPRRGAVSASRAPIESRIAPTSGADGPAPVAPIAPPPAAPPWAPTMAVRPDRPPPNPPARASAPAPAAQSSPASPVPVPATVAPAPSSEPVAPTPVEPAPREATSDGDRPRRALATGAATPASPGDRSEPSSPGTPSSGVGAALRPSGDAGAGHAGEGTDVATGKDSGSPTASGGEAMVARLPGNGETRGAADGAIPLEYESYVRSLRQRVQDRLVYPWTAVRRGQQGVVELEVRVGPDGRLIGVEVVAGASAESLRAAAVAAVRGSAPFPFPAGLAVRSLVVRLPVEFRLR